MQSKNLQPEFSFLLMYNYLNIVCLLSFFACSLQISSKSSIATKKIPSIFNVPLLKAYATQSGRVPIMKDSLGFYVAVDLADDSYDASDTDFGPDTVAMTLGLYTSDTLLANNCLGFKQYNCDEYSCSPVPNRNVSHEYAHFTVEGIDIISAAYLDYNNWNLNSWAVLANSCSSRSDIFYNSTRSGMIGLGIDGSSQLNFLEFPIFSVEIDKDLSSGVLLFGIDLSDDAESTTPVAVLDSDANWQVNVTGSIQVGSTSASISTRLIFDINTDAIGLPLGIYREVKANFEQAAAIKCSEDNYYPTCMYTHAIEDLPSIILQIGSQSITIPPDVFAQPSSRKGSGYIVLNLKGLSPDLNNASYTPSSFNNTIILGYNFMSYYYTVFNSSLDSTYSITLYTAAIPPDESSWVITLIEILGAVSFVIVCICCYFSCRDKFKRKVRPQTFQASNISGSLIPGRRRGGTAFTCTSSVHEEEQPHGDLYTTFLNPNQNNEAPSDRLGAESRASESRPLNGSTI